MPKSVIKKRIRKLEDEMNSYQHNDLIYGEYRGRIKELYNVLGWRKGDDDDTT